MERIKKIFGLEGKRTRWVIIKETDNEATQLFLGIQPLNSNVAVKLCEKRFVSKMVWKPINFTREIYPAQKTKLADKFKFTAKIYHNEQSDEILEIIKPQDFIETFLADMIYSKELETKAFLL